MRVTEVDMVSDTFEEPINLRLSPAQRTGQFQIRQIIGLDADEINHKFFVGGHDYKTKHYEAFLKPREIVIRVILNPRFHLDENYSDVRDELYRYISRSRTRLVSLHFKSGPTTVSKIDGYISKLEAAHFTKLPEVQITITCDDPIFRGLSSVELPDFVSNHVNGVINVPDSLSTAPHGCRIEAVFGVDNNTSFEMYDKEIDYDMSFDFEYDGPAGDFDIGDKIILSSETGNKGVWVQYLDNEYYSGPLGLMERVSNYSIWPTIFPGDNQFYFPQLEANKFSSLKISYTPTYWGI